MDSSFGDVIVVGCFCVEAILFVATDEFFDCDDFHTGSVGFGEGSALSDLGLEFLDNVCAFSDVEVVIPVFV